MFEWFEFYFSNLKNEIAICGTFISESAEIGK